MNIELTPSEEGEDSGKVIGELHLESGDHDSLVPDAIVDELNIELAPSDESGNDDGGI
ncbi:MAG: hypothetical protein HOH33_10055 [Verrucomicrobia bacterium]|nr:hypothetical protein [Verrucomicrobiota bacterium]